MTELCSLAAGCLVLMLVELEMVPCLRRGDGGDGLCPGLGALEMVVNGDGVIGWFGLHRLKELSKSDQTESTGQNLSLTTNQICFRTKPNRLNSNGSVSLLVWR